MSFCRKQKDRALNNSFLQKYRKNRKKLFLQKEVLSAEITPFCSLILSKSGITLLCRELQAYRKRLFLQKEPLSAETASFCRKTERAFLIRKSFCRISAEIFGRKATGRLFRLTTTNDKPRCDCLWMDNHPVSVCMFVFLNHLKKYYLQSQNVTDTDLGQSVAKPASVQCILGH